MVEGSPPVKESTQILTVSGQVIGTDTGQVRVEILAGADQTVIHSQQGPVDDGSYRVTLVDLSNNLTPKFSNQNQIRAVLLNQDNNPVEETEAIGLNTNQISSGLVELPTIVLAPEISLQPVINLEQIYVGVGKLFEFSLSNQGHVDLEINGISTSQGSGLQVLASYPIIIGPDSSQDVSVNLLTETVGDYNQTVTI